MARWKKRIRKVYKTAAKVVLLPLRYNPATLTAAAIKSKGKPKLFVQTARRSTATPQKWLKTQGKGLVQMAGIGATAGLGVGAFSRLLGGGGGAVPQEGVDPAGAGEGASFFDELLGGGGGAVPQEGVDPAGGGVYSYNDLFGGNGATLTPGSSPDAAGTMSDSVNAPRGPTAQPTTFDKVMETLGAGGTAAGGPAGKPGFLADLLGNVFGKPAAKELTPEEKRARTRKIVVAVVIVSGVVYLIVRSNTS